MRTALVFLSIALAGGLSLPASAKAPSDATGECKDGTYTKAAAKEGACSSHGGVKDWFEVKAAPIPRPANATGQCDDGTYSTAASKSGACSGHKGVKEWYAADAKGTPAKAPASQPEPKSAPAPTSTSSTRTNTSYTPPVNAAPGGGNGMVWLNTSSKVYHCPKDKWYGRTKHGKYMTEAEAKATGAHSDHRKACT